MKTADAIKSATRQINESKQKPCVIVASKPDKNLQVINQFLLTDEWKNKHGYFGGPSTKRYIFGNEDDRKQFTDYLDQKKIPYELGEF